MPGKLKIQVWDSTLNEGPASMSVPIDPAADPGDITTLIGALDALSVGNFGQQSLLTETAIAAGLEEHVASLLAQKEIRFRVGFTDNSNSKKYSFTIPAANLSLLIVGTENLDLTAGTGLALKNAFEAIGQSELGNTVTLNYVRFVGL